MRDTYDSHVNYKHNNYKTYTYMYYICLMHNLATATTYQAKDRQNYHLLKIKYFEVELFISKT